jgi:hypothetical protein
MRLNGIQKNSFEQIGEKLVAVYAPQIISDSPWTFVQTFDTIRTIKAQKGLYNTKGKPYNDDDTR